MNELKPCPRCAELERELAQERKRSSELANLLMRGEQMRESLMLRAICSGAFTQTGEQA